MKLPTTFVKVLVSCMAIGFSSLYAADSQFESKNLNTQIDTMNQIKYARRGARESREEARSSKSSEKKKTAKFPYSYLLPFGYAQLDQGKKALGISLAAGQAGFLLLYFDRMQQIRTANDDAIAMMKDVDRDKARQDPSLLSYLDENEAFVKKAQYDARLAMIGFLGLYTFGIAELVYDPFSKFGVGQSKPTKRRRSESGIGEEEGHENTLFQGPRRLAEESSQEAKDFEADESLFQPQIGLNFQPFGSRPSFGLTLTKPF